MNLDHATQDFSARESSPQSTPLIPRTHLILAGAFLFTLSCFILLPLLDLVDISNVGEGREGTVVQEIIDSGNFILPLRNGQFVPSKPILFHWITYLCTKLTGSVDLVSLRLPSALAGIGTVMLVWVLATCYGGLLTGLVAGLLMLSTQGLIANASEGRVDSVFSFFVVLSITIWLLGLRRLGEKPLKEMPGIVYHLAGIACGLSFLTKGPVGLVFVGIVLGAVTISEFGIRQTRDLLRLGWIWAVLIPLPWYIAAAFIGTDHFIGRHVIYENIRRWTGGQGITAKAWWWYFPQLVMYCFPWSITYIGLLISAAKRQRRALWKDRDSVSHGIRVSICWFVLPFLFLCTASGKHSAYLAPLLPGLSIGSALWMTKIVNWPTIPPRLDRIFAIGSVALIAGGMILALLSPLLGLFPGNFGLSARSFFEAISPRWRTVVFLYFVMGGATLYLIATRARRSGTFAAWGPPTIALVLLINGFYIQVGRAVRGITHGDREFSEQLIATIPPTTPINWVIRLGTDPKLGVGREDSFDSIFFYLRRRVRLLDNKLTWNEPGLYVARRSWVDAQSPEWRARMTERFEGGKRDDKPHERMVVFDLAPEQSQNPQEPSAVDAETSPPEPQGQIPATGEGETVQSAEEEP